MLNLITRRIIIELESGQPVYKKAGIFLRPFTTVRLPRPAEYVEVPTAVGTLIIYLNSVGTNASIKPMTKAASRLPSSETER